MLNGAQPCVGGEILHKDVQDKYSSIFHTGVNGAASCPSLSGNIPPAYIVLMVGLHPVDKAGLSGCPAGLSNGLLDQVFGE